MHVQAGRSAKKWMLQEWPSTNESWGGGWPNTQLPHPLVGQVWVPHQSWGPLANSGNPLLTHTAFIASPCPTFPLPHCSSSPVYQINSLHTNPCLRGALERTKPNWGAMPPGPGAWWPARSHLTPSSTSSPNTEQILEYLFCPKWGNRGLRMYRDQWVGPRRQNTAFSKLQTNNCIPSSATHSRHCWNIFELLGFPNSSMMFITQFYFSVSLKPSLCLQLHYYRREAMVAGILNLLLLLSSS